MNILRRSPAVPVVALLLGGAAAGSALWWSAPELAMSIRVSVALLLFEAAVLAAAAVAAVLLVRRRLALAREAAAAAEQEEHRRFLRRLDHELKNPLTAIRVGLANLSGQRSDSKPEPVVAAIDTQVRRLSRLVGDLRKLAEIAEAPIAAAPVDVDALLHEAAAAAADLPDGDRRAVSVSVPSVPWRLPPVAGDRDLLEMALGNLVANAVKYSADGATVELRGFEENGQVVLEVADSGMGIPPDEVAEVWQELVRGKAARGLTGSGLGLPLVSVIVRRHGGTCELRSRPGDGTAVRVRLPAAADRS